MDADTNTVTDLPFSLTKNYPHFPHGQRMSDCILDNARMKNESNRMDPELEKQIEGLTTNQIRLLSSIYNGLARRLRQTAAETPAKRKASRDNRKN